MSLLKECKNLAKEYNSIFNILPDACIRRETALKNFREDGDQDQITSQIIKAVQEADRDIRYALVKLRRDNRKFIKLDTGHTHKEINVLIHAMNKVTNAGDKGWENAKILSDYTKLFEEESQDIRETLKNLATLLKKQSSETDPEKFIALEKHIRKVASKARKIIDTNYSKQMWNLVHHEYPDHPIAQYSYKDSWLHGVEDPFWVYVKVTGAIATYLNVLCEEAEAHENLEKLRATPIPFSKLAWRMNNIQQVVPKLGTMEIEFGRFVAWLLFNARYANRSYNGFDYPEFKTYLSLVVSNLKDPPGGWDPIPEEFNELRNIDKSVYEQLWIDVIAGYVFEWTGDEDLKESPASRDFELDLSQLQKVAKINEIENHPMIHTSNNPTIREYLENHHCPYGWELHAPNEELMQRFRAALDFIDKNEYSWKRIADDSMWMSMIQNAYRDILSPERYQKRGLHWIPSG